MDRLFYAGCAAFAHKPAAAIASARRAGTTASIDVLNKYFTFAQMPVVSSTYWNMVHGNSPDEVKNDLEGLQTMRNLAMNMAWLLKCIELGKENNIHAPVSERNFRTNFIR
jgi:multimeric flavodoxin WrbA